MSSSVEFTDRQVQGCIIIDVKADNFVYPQTPLLKNHVAHLIEQGVKFIALNMGGIGIIDSYGLATIISIRKMTKEIDGGLVLYGLNDMLTHLVEVTHLDRALDIWPSEAQALYFLSSTYKLPSA